MSLFLRSIYVSSGLSLLYIFLLYRSNPLRRLSGATVTLSFALGMGAVIPVVLFRRFFPFESTASLFSAYVNAGLVEEGVKFLVLAGTIWWLGFPDLAEPIDFVIYLGVLGAGFGIYEDFWYIFSGSYNIWIGGDVGRFREVFSAIVLARSFPGHVLFGGIAGYLVGHARFLRTWHARLAWLVGGFILAVGLHGTFNLIASAGGTIPLLTYCVLLVGVFVYLRRMALAHSPFRALVRLITKGTGEWPYPRSPVDYLFAEGFSWPAESKGGMFQAFPLALSLLILYPFLVVAVYLVNRLLVWILPP